MRSAHAHSRQEPPAASSSRTAAALRRKMAELMESFDELTRGDEMRPTGQAHTRGSCLLVALREWEPNGFRALRRTGAGEKPE